MSDIEGHALPSWSDVLSRDYQPWDSDRLVLDTARLTVDACVRSIISASALPRT